MLQRFNPTVVRLLPLSQHLLQDLPLSFNPTVVRLLLEFDYVTPEGNTVSIPQWCDCCAEEYFNLLPDDAGFNPTVVRLLLLFDVPNVHLQSVSIPQWCDCCQGKNLGFDGKMKRKGKGVAVDLRLPEEPKGVDGN